MNITREDMPGRQVALTIELPTDTVNEALDRAYRQLVNQVNVPGFRRGKAPRYVLESYVGREMLTERAINNILPQTVQDAVREQNIEALDIGDVEILSMDPVQVKVIVVQPPRVELGDYSDVRAEREQVEVTQEQVDEVLAELRREGAPWEEPAEPRPIREGDMVYINLEGFSGAGEMPEAKREEFPTIVGMQKGSGVPEVVNQALVGMQVGEEKDVADTLPEDYPNEELRGRDVTYHVTVLSMKEQQLPELDDEFAKQHGYDTLEALRTAVEENLRRRIEESAESKQVDAAIEQLTQRATVELPEMMVKEELDGMLKRLEERLKQQRLTLRQFFTYTGTTEQEWRERNRERAEARLTTFLVLQEFARREGISVEDQEIDGEINTILERFEGQEREQAQTVLDKQESKSELENRIFQRKLVDRLIGIAEGRIQVAPFADDRRQTTGDGSAGEAAQAEQSVGADGEAAKADEAEADATVLEEAGGAAELLGTEGVDTQSPYETGQAEGGGTPEEAPRLR